MSLAVDLTANFDFLLGPEHKALREAVRRWVDQKILPNIREWDQKGEMPDWVLREMGEMGLLGVCIPARYGGAGMDYLALAVVCEELERGDTALRTILSVHVGLNSMTLFTWGTEEQKQKYLVPQARGEKIAAFALTEAGAGSDVAAMRTTARREGDVYILNGEKMWISLADTADHFLVFAYTDREKGHRGITAFLVERSFPGITTGRIHGKMGIRSGDTGWIAFQDTPVPVENRLGEEGEGFKIAMNALDNGRYTVAAGAAGAIQAALEASVAYARERKTFGKEIGEHQLIKRMIAHMVMKLEATRLLVYKVGWMKNQGIPHSREVSLAKLFGTQAAFEAAADAVQIHGAYGYVDEYPVERILRNAKAPVIYEGTREIHELIQADFVLGYRRRKPLRRELPPYDPEEWEREA